MSRDERSQRNGSCHAQGQGAAATSIGPGFGHGGPGGLKPGLQPPYGGYGGAVRGPGGLLARWPSHGSAEK